MPPPASHMKDDKGNTCSYFVTNKKSTGKIIAKLHNVVFVRSHKLNILLYSQNFLIGARWQFSNLSTLLRMTKWPLLKLAFQ